MDKIAIFDIGTARTKVAISSRGNDTIERYKFDTKLSESIVDGSMDIDYVKSVLIPKLQEYKNIAASNGCKRLATVGTHVFRAIDNSKEVTSIIKSSLGSFSIIEGWTEGAILYSWIKSTSHSEEIAVIDIGGGSVQIAFGDKPECIASIPTGTFSLEKEYQSNTEVTTSEEMQKMIQGIRASLRTLNIEHRSQATKLIFGSNCMIDFINAVAKELQIEVEESISFYERILSAIAGRPYKELGTFYPDNPMFMYGADKALVNLIEIAKHYGFAKIVPTNESVSSALFNLLGNDPERLEPYDISYTSI